MGDSPKWVKSKKRRRKRERLNNGDNNGQATHGARKARMAHTSRLGQLSNDIQNIQGNIL